MIPHPNRPLLFLDYDGTLSPIVDDPAQARPHPDVPALLASLAERHRVVIVSGRGIAKLTHFLPGVRVQAVGLHGAEEGALGEEPAPSAALQAVAEPLAALKASVPALEGVMVEDKGATFAVHYRNARDEAAAHEALRAWASDVPEGLHAVWGKKVLELRPRDLSKGTAVVRIAAENPALTPVYIGDDTTDEDAFQALDASSGEREPVTVKVGEGETAARYRVPGVDDVVTYLRGFL
ncbi:trehalose-phosphatase [Rubricoccus marinus]|uniref:trehalose-phosphatase n=1 Tax=Rubricoccus marinus TaxID=716817 RepID=UPI000B983AC4|nr:trehalose-phosphatase [Rubricoccus marinus]